MLVFKSSHQARHQKKKNVLYFSLDAKNTNKQLLLQRKRIILKMQNITCVCTSIYRFMFEVLDYRLRNIRLHVYVAVIESLSHNVTSVNMTKFSQDVSFKLLVLLFFEIVIFLKVLYANTSKQLFIISPE